MGRITQGEEQETRNPLPRRRWATAATHRLEALVGPKAEVEVSVEGEISEVLDIADARADRRDVLRRQGWVPSDLSRRPG